MKLALGAKLSIGQAVICSGLWGTLAWWSPHNADKVPLWAFCEFALMVLTFPLVWISFIFRHSGHPVVEMTGALVLLIPNCFLVGYTLAAAINYAGRRIGGAKRNAERASPTGGPSAPVDNNSNAPGGSPSVS